MIFTAIMIFVALLALTSVLLLAYGSAARVRDVAELGRRLHPLDLQAFRNLTDRAEEEFLRGNLSRAKFRRVQRARLRAIAAYVRMAAYNAGVLIRIGTLAQTSPEPATVAAAQILVRDALQMRLLAAVVMVRISVCMVWPGLRSSPAILGDRYERLVLRAGSLGQNWTRTSAALAS